MKSAIRNLGIPRNLSLPNPPVILKTESNGNQAKIYYRGTAGATNYSLVSSANPDQTIQNGIFDHFRDPSMIELDLQTLSSRSVQLVAYGDWGRVSSSVATI